MRTELLPSYFTLTHWLSPRCIIQVSASLPSSEIIAGLRRWSRKLCWFCAVQLLVGTTFGFYRSRPLGIPWDSFLRRSLGISWDSFPCSSLIPWIFPHFQDLSSRWHHHLPFWVLPPSKTASFLLGTLLFVTNSSSEYTKSTIFPVEIFYVLKHNICLLIGGSASSLLINVSTFP